MGMSVFEMEDVTVEQVTGSEGLKPAPCRDGGTEYGVRIVGFLRDDKENIIRTSKRGAPFIMPEMEIYGTAQDHLYKTFSTYVGLPDRGSIPDAKKFEQTAFNFKTFMEAFGQEITSSIDFNALDGESAEAILAIEDDAQYGAKNIVKRWVTSH
jgi:hypothetical protein